MSKKLWQIPLIIVGVLAAVYVIAALLAKPAPAHPWFQEDDSVLVIAHQGGEAIRPSNTMAAFEHAVDLGVDVLESDVHVTADNVLVLIHDETVDRTTDGTGEVESMTLDEIKALDAGYEFTQDGETYPYRGQGVTIATVEELFTTFPDMRYVLEIKKTERPIGGLLCDLMRAHEMEDQVIVASFHAEAMDEFRRVCPEVATAAYEDEVRTFFILNTLFLGDLYTPTAHALQVPETSGGLHVVTPRFIKGAHRRNMVVQPWTINDPDDMRRLIEWGVDGIMTDYPDQLLEILGR